MDKASSQPVVGRLGGLGLVAADLGEGRGRTDKGKAPSGVIPFLRLEAAPVNGPAVEAGHGARLQSVHRVSHPGQRVREPVGRRGTIPSPRALQHPGVELAAQIGPGGNDGGAASQDAAVCKDNPRQTTGPDAEIDDLTLVRRESGLSQDPPVHASLVKEAIDLGPARTYGKTLAGVQVLELDGGGIGTERHLSAQGVQLADEVALALPTNRWIAGHAPHAAEAQGHQQGACTHPGRGQRRFTA